MTRSTPIAILLSLLACLASTNSGATEYRLDLVPGVVVNHVPSPTLAQLNDRKAVYTASPSIVVLPDGRYVVTDNIFGAGSGASTSGTTKVFRSSDKGQSWQHLTTLHGMKRGSLFVHQGDLYLLGYFAAPGDIVIRRSIDSGETWTEPNDTRSGLIRVGRFGGTPNRPVVHDGRIWVGQSGNRFLSADVDADLLNGASWLLSASANTKSGPLGKDLIITEAQIVASPSTGVVLLPKIGGLPNTVLIRAGNDPSEIVSPHPKDWVSLPGGEKKFAASYDSVSKTFFALSNPVLPRYRNSEIPPQLVRNVGALLSSKDLKTWQVLDVFLESQHIEHEAFQYFSFDIDGEDLVIASRTAFDVGGPRPPRGHDSNLTTFHRIRDFRKLESKPSLN